jgi:uncharacterized protein (DUF1501 family)
MSSRICVDPADRRRWMLRAGATLAGTLGIGGLASFGVPLARAQSGYKALVCVFLYGGNDGMNMVVPRDATRHSQYAAVRGELALPRGSLVGLNSDYGLHPAMAALAPIWAAGDLVPVLNVGPLAVPMTKSDYLAATPELLPESLFSHSDQQIQWESAGVTSIARTGWGGRAASTMGSANPVISFGGNGHFGLAEYTAPLVLPGPGSSFGLEGLDGTWEPTVARRTALEALYAQAGGSTLIGRFSSSQREAVAVSTRLGGLISQQVSDASPALRAAFATLTDAQGNITSDFARQLFQVAKMIEGRATVMGNSQLFFTQMGGFDTHSAQVSVDSMTGDHAGLMKVLADGLAAFQTAMNSIGMMDAVTLFTQSDFGRTFAPNSSLGTDHAWGNHQLVMGGAVQGSAIYGVYPELVLGGPSDVGVDEWELQGRWIPSISVDQYAATLLRWFGANDAQLNSILPNLVNFGTRNLGFLA